MWAIVGNMPGSLGGLGRRDLEAPGEEAGGEVLALVGAVVAEAVGMVVLGEAGVGCLMTPREEDWTERRVRVMSRG
jgi:hypothetical protein